MRSSWIHHVRGKTTRQARVGTVGVMYEELVGRQGFFGPTAMLYHRASPSEVLRVEGALASNSADVRGLKADDLDDDRGDFSLLLSNHDVRIGLSRRRKPMPYCYRNVTGDLLYFVHTGTGAFLTEFGPLAYEPGDYVLLPKGTTFRHFPESDDGLFFVVESSAPLRFTEHTQIGRHAPFDPAVIEVPDVTSYEWPAQSEWELRVKHDGGLTSVFYRNCPMDLIGWKGDFFPLRINIRDIIPISSDRIHLAPTSWATFETDAFIVVTFLPQMAVSDLTAEELPSNHRNVDCDEALFIHDDDQGRTGIVMHFPQGLMHGATEAVRDAFNLKRTPGMRRALTSVSIDTFAPLVPTQAYLGLTKAS